MRDFNASGVLTGLSQFDYDAFGQRVIDFRDSNGDATWDQYDRWFNDGENRLIQARDYDGATGTLPVKISNRFLHGDMNDRVLAKENFQAASVILLDDEASPLFRLVSVQLGDGSHVSIAVPPVKRS